MEGSYSMDFKRPDKSAGHGEARPPARPRSGGHRPPPRAEDNIPDDRTRISAPLRPDALDGLEDPAPEGRGGRQKKEKKPKGKIKKGTVVKVMFLNVLKAGFVMLCIAAMVGSIAAVQVVQYVVEETENDGTMLDLENYQMNQTSYFMAYDPTHPEADEDGYYPYQELVGTEDRIWVSYEEIPQNLINAVIATEDREFNEHHGVNFRRTAAALVNEIIPISGMKGGASTITQQLVKNITDDDDVVGDDGDRSAGYKRKLREIFRAWGLHNRYSRDLIMESYLNTIGLSERIAGVGAGAKRYFDKEVKDLTLAECAVIAGITQAPTRYSPIQNPENARERRNNVLNFMEECGYITLAERNAAKAEPLGLNLTSASGGESSTAGVFSYASDKAYNDVIEDLVDQKVVTSYAEARRYLYNGGLKVYLTVDLKVQAALDDIMVDGYEEDGFFMDETRFPGYVRAMTKSEEIKNGTVVVDHQEVLPQCAVAVIDYSGQLIATSGGIGEKTTSLSLNRSIGTLAKDANGEYIYDADGNHVVDGTVRQTGSTMKPIAAYALGIDYGIIHYSKMVKDEGVMSRNAANPSRDAETGKVVKDWPKNFGITRHSNIPVVSAVAESTNTVPCQIGMWLGLEPMYEFLVDTLEVTSLADPVDMGLGPLVLGSQTYGMSAYELAGAYMMFGGEESYGVKNTLHSYTKVVDSKGNIVLQPELAPQQAIKPESGYVMNRLLNNVLDRGSWPGGASPTAGGMRPVDGEGEPIEAVAKTGTTSDDNDRWFVGLTPHYVVAVWWGYDVKHQLDNWSPRASTNIPVNVWKALIESIWDDLPEKHFPDMPEGVVVEKFCTSSGNLARPGCPSMEGYYTSDHVPEECRGHEREPGEEGAEPPPA